jgi:hypothetical protein
VSPPGGGALWLFAFPRKNPQSRALLLFFCVLLQSLSHARPSASGERCDGGTLRRRGWPYGRGGHYLMLKRHRCFVYWSFERRKFNLRIKDNVGSGCYGYGTTVSRGVQRGFANPHAHFPRRYVQIPAWADSLSSISQGFSYGLNDRRVETDAHVLHYVGSE